MLESYPSYYWIVAQFLQPLQEISENRTPDDQARLITRAMHGIDMFLRADGMAEMLPRSTEKARAFQQILQAWFNVIAGRAPVGSAGITRPYKKLLMDF
jgi:hypothetical protein